MLITLLAVAVATAQPQSLRNFGWWEVGCDNVLSCRAVAFPDGGGDYGLSVSRDGEAAALAKVILDVDGVVAAASDEKRVPLHFDEKHELSAGDVRALLQFIATAQKLEFVDGTGKVVASIHPKGLSAALRWIDKRQQRSGTVTALIAKGPRPASSVPAPPPLPTITLPARSAMAPAKLTPAQVSEIRKSYECEDREDEAVEYHRLDDATTLAIAPCSSGAYQEGGVALLVSNEGRYRAAPLEFAKNFSVRGHFQGEDYTVIYYANKLLEPDFDAKDLSLATYSKGRGKADCGVIKEYIWDGYRFRLSYYSRLDGCIGARDHFIALWRTSNHPLRDLHLPFEDD